MQIETSADRETDHRQPDEHDEKTAQRIHSRPDEDRRYRLRQWKACSEEMLTGSTVKGCAYLLRNFAIWTL